MTFTKSTLAASVALAIGMGSVGVANAEIYAGGSLDISNLKVRFSDVPATNISLFTFSVNSTASLDGAGANAGQKICTGEPVTGGFTTCSKTAPILYAGVADINGGRTTNAGPPPSPTATTFDAIGNTTAKNYASSSSVIDQAELIDAINGTFNSATSSTALSTIGETNLTDGLQGATTTNVNSVTNLNYAATIGTTQSVTITFDANFFNTALVDETNPPTAADLSTSTMGVVYTLQQTSDAGGSTSLEKGVFSPTTAGGGCTDNTNVQLFNGLTCTSTTVANKLNSTVQQGPNLVGTTTETSSGAAETYSITFANLKPGTWSLSLVYGLNENVTRIPSPTPEPASLLLLGTGVAAMGAIGRRRRKTRSA